jgi:hypothetical protein
MGMFQDCGLLTPGRSLYCPEQAAADRAALEALDLVLEAGPEFPPDCPACQAPREWEHLEGGGLNACCARCGRKGCFDQF